MEGEHGEREREKLPPIYSSHAPAVSKQLINKPVLHIWASTNPGFHYARDVHKMSTFKTQ